ncbi:PilX N-terminal domain-containing pilus assembly protein [Geoalkalibacter sp.]|uniref:PilX N-terminal domain-containing pilus assembly protein n=1 Tax=Geoalkalibacter sp. TaxID=3041440 RepID=UPI00272E414C|nr:PilX N-terminal domain-containing pilus assembly protein [Geoalkalibacter sp.]
MRTPVLGRNRERGAALLSTLMVLALLTLLGMAASGAALVEIAIARNEQLRAMAFYRAESGWRYGLAWLARAPRLILDDQGSQTSPAPWDEAFAPHLAAGPLPLQDETGAALFAVTIELRGASHPVLYSTDFQRLDYRLSATGFAAHRTQARIEVEAGRLLAGGGY